MADIELNMRGEGACENTYEQKDGLYQCNLVRFTGAGFKFDSMQSGPLNPAEVPIGALAAALMSDIRRHYRMFDDRPWLPYEQMVGLSVVRLCMREHEEKKDDEDDGAERFYRAERVASYAFVRSTDNFFPLEYDPELPSHRRMTPRGVGRALRLGATGMKKINNVFHLPVSPEENEKFPVRYAIPSMAHRGSSKDATIALRPLEYAEEKFSDSRFLETVVTREELLDTAPKRV